MTKSRPPKLQLKRIGCACSKSGAAFAAHISRTKIHASGFERTEASYFIVGADSDATRQYSTSMGFAPHTPAFFLFVPTGCPGRVSSALRIGNPADLFLPCCRLTCPGFCAMICRFYGALLCVIFKKLKTTLCHGKQNLTLNETAKRSNFASRYAQPLRWSGRDIH